MPCWVFWWVVWPMARNLRHPHVVQLFEIIETRGQPEPGSGLRRLMVSSPRCFLGFTSSWSMPPAANSSTTLSRTNASQSADSDLQRCPQVRTLCVLRSTALQEPEACRFFHQIIAGASTSARAPYRREFPGRSCASDSAPSKGRANSRDERGSSRPGPG